MLIVFFGDAHRRWPRLPANSKSSTQHLDRGECLHPMVLIFEKSPWWKSGGSLGIRKPIFFISWIWWIRCWPSQVCGKIFLEFWSSHSEAQSLGRQCQLPRKKPGRPTVSSTAICFLQFFFKFGRTKMVDCLHQYLKCVEDLDPPWTSDTRAKWHLVNLGESWHWLTGCDWPMTGLSYAHWLPPHAETLRSTGQWRPGPLVCHLWKCESAFFCRDFFPKVFHMVQWWTQCTPEGWLKKPCVILQSYFLRLPGFKIFSSLWFLLKGWQGMIFWGSESEKFLAEEKQGDFLVFGQSTCQWVFFFEGMPRLWEPFEFGVPHPASS